MIPVSPFSMHHNMTFVNSKSHLLGAQILKICISLILLQHHNVNSQQSPPLLASETVSFSFTTFELNNPEILILGDTSVSDGVLRLTKTDQQGKPLPQSVGRVVSLTPVHLWDKKSGELADFSSGFSFVVNSNGSTLHGDGFAFFIAPLEFHLPKNSSGGYLGLFKPETALDPTKNQIVAIDFDVGSIKSVASAAWPSEFDNAVAHASINYNSESKRLSVFLSYPGNNVSATVSYVVDLRTVLPEWVRVGLSAATGELVETHDIINWFFEAAL